MANITFDITDTNDAFPQFIIDANEGWLDQVAYSFSNPANTDVYSITMDTSFIAADIQTGFAFYIATDGTLTSTVTSSEINITYTTPPSGMTINTEAIVYVFPETFVDSQADLSAYRNSGSETKYTVNPTEPVAGQFTYKLYDIGDTLTDFIPKAILVVFHDATTYFVRRVIFEL